MKISIRENWFRIFVVLSLWLIPLYLIPGFIIFEPFPFWILGKASYWGVVVFFVLLFAFMLWFGLGRKSGNSRKVLLFRLGFRKNWCGFTIGLVVGGGVGGLMWYLQEGGLSSSLNLVELTLSSIIVAPLLEEILFRGFLINKLLDFKEKTLGFGVLAILSSIFLFAFVHLHNPTYKLIGGTVFTLIYLWGWKNNMVSAIAAHSASNSAAIFLSFTQGGIPALGTLTLIVPMTFALLLIVWKINLAFKIIEKIISYWLKLGRKIVLLPNRVL